MGKSKKSPRTTAGQPSVGTIATYESHASREDLYGSRSSKAGTKLLRILPLIVAIAFMLIADIDSPRHGIILVKPQNLISLAESLPPGTP